jgi:hypothetical protein
MISERKYVYTDALDFSWTRATPHQNPRYEEIIDLILIVGSLTGTPTSHSGAVSEPTITPLPYFSLIRTLQVTRLMSLRHHTRHELREVQYDLPPLVATILSERIRENGGRKEA